MVNAAVFFTVCLLTVTSVPSRYVEKLVPLLNFLFVFYHKIYCINYDINV